MNSIEPALLAGVEGPCIAAIQQCAVHLASIHLHLSVVGQNGIVPRRAIAVAALQFRLFSSVFRERLLEMVRPR